MSITFNVDEIFEIAEQIERNGAKFYKEASGKASDKKIKKMLLDLSKMESKHIAIFQKMRKSLTKKDKEADTFDPDNQAAMYLQTMADSSGTEGRITPKKKLTGKESTKEILEIALNSEKDSVIYYFGLKSFVPTESGQNNIEKIIKQELSHISILNKYLVELL